MGWEGFSQCQYTDAHQLLAEVYSWFREGFYTADVQEARALWKP